VDSLRALAALAVVLSHVVFITGGPGGPHAWWSALFTNGVQGVTVFFVISGFLLYRPFVNAQLNGAPRSRLRDYFRRRLLRIVPAYWLALSLLAIYPGLAGVFTHDWWRYYFLLSGYSNATISHGLLVSWSLGIEVSFYLLLPLYAALVGRVTRGFGVDRRLRAELSLLGAIALASTVLRLIDYETARSAAIENSLPAFMYWFALGMGLALLSTVAQQRPDSRTPRLLAARPGACWAAAAAAYALLCLIQNTNGTYSTAQWVLGYYLLGGVIALLLVLPAVLGPEAEGWPLRVLALPALAWLGLISYGLYLWHVPIAVVGFDHGVRSFVPLAIGVGLVTVVCAAASYYVVERPILRWK
jgi:peptidoglycan/LPS O-acetylase OafA/YrhL